MVQGVSIDPLLKYIVTMSSDATVRGYKNRRLKTSVQFFHKFTVKSREEQSQSEESGGGGQVMEGEGADAEMKEAAEGGEMGGGAGAAAPKKGSHRMFLDDVEYLS